MRKKVGRVNTRREPITEALLKLAAQKVPGDPRGRTYAEVLAERLLKAALRGNVAAFREIANRVEGEPQQRIEVTHHFVSRRTEAG